MMQDAGFKIIKDNLISCIVIVKKYINVLKTTPCPPFLRGNYVEYSF